MAGIESNFCQVGKLHDLHQEQIGNVHTKEYSDRLIDRQTTPGKSRIFEAEATSCLEDIFNVLSRCFAGLQHGASGGILDQVVW